MAATITAGTRHAQALDAASKLLADVESELRQADAGDDQIGKHADDADSRLQAELHKRRGHLDIAGNDPDAEAEYLHLSGQRRRAQQVSALARHAKELR